MSLSSGKFEDGSLIFLRKRSFIATKNRFAYQVHISNQSSQGFAPEITGSNQARKGRHFLLFRSLMMIHRGLFGQLWPDAHRSGEPGFLCVALIAASVDFPHSSVSWTLRWLPFGLRVASGGNSKIPRNIKRGDLTLRGSKARISERYFRWHN